MEEETLELLEAKALADVENNTHTIDQQEVLKIIRTFLEEVKNKDGIGYKIIAGRECIVNRQDYNGKVFYSIPVCKKNKDNTTEYGKKPVKFRTGVELKDKTRIIIKTGFEDFYKKDKYNSMFTLFIDEFDIVSQPAEVANEAYDTFNSYDDSFVDLPF